MQMNLFSHGPRRSRRRFLAGCSALTLSAAVIPTSVLALPAGQRKNLLDPIGFNQFATCMGNSFRVWQDGVLAGHLVLVEAQPELPNPRVAPRAPDARNEKFSLIFEGSLDSPLTQNTYVFEHASLGGFLMFIVPVYSPRSPRALYQAIFNRPFAPSIRRER